jgi:hypothetical protein
MHQNTNFTIRVDSQLLSQFLSACRSNNVPASQLLRQYMHTYFVLTRQPLNWRNRARKKRLAPTPFELGLMP